MLGDRTEGAATEAAALNRNRETDHLVRGNLAVAVERVRYAPIRQLVDRIHLLHRQRQRRRIQPHIDIAVPLNQRACVPRVRFEMQDARCMRIENRVLCDLIERRHANDGLRAVAVRNLAEEAHDMRGRTGCAGLGARPCNSRCGVGGLAGFPVFVLAGSLRLGRIQVRIHRRIQLARLIDRRRIDFCPAFGHGMTHERGPAQIGDVLDLFALAESMCDLDDLALSIAVDEQVRLRIQQDRAAHFLGPVIEMRDATQAGFDAADHDRYVAVRFAHALRIHDDGSIGTFAAFAAGRVGVIAADAAIRGVAIHHRIHVAAGHAEEQIRFAEPLEVLFRMPVGLRDDADAKSLSFEDPADDGHAEARMIHVGIACHDDDVAAVPPEHVHFLARHRQERSRPEAGRPVLAI